MSPIQQQLDLFSDLSAFEGTDVEYKGAKGGLPGDLWSTYSAFANTEGGTIYLGISQRGHEIDVHGVENPEKLIADFWNTVNNRSKINCNLLGNHDVEQLAIEGTAHKVIAIHVPRASRQQRPVFIGSDPRTGTYRRNYEGDYRCSDSEVRRMFADQSEEPADSRIMDGFSLDDLHFDSLRQYRNRFQSRASSHPWLAKDDQGLLEQLGGWRRDRIRNQEGLTLAGLLMFGKTSAIQAVEAVPGFQLDYRERLSDDPRVRWSDRLTVDGTWEANLFQFYQQAMAKFASDPGLKRPFAQDAEGVRPMGTPVHEALQEALVNALIHADYSGQGGIVIDRFGDRFEFSNPGTLLVSLEQILRGGVSECRNKSLQVMFQMLGVGDKAGSGIDKIRDSWKSLHWQSPRLEETQRPDRVVLALPLVSMLPEAVLAGLSERFGSRFRALDKDSVQVLVTTQMEGFVSNHRLQEILTLHRRDITSLLQSLVKEGLLVPDGFGRGTRYELGTGNALPDKLAIPPDSLAIPPDKAAIPPDKRSAPPDRALIAIAEPVRSTRRADPAVTKATILSLCQGRFLSLRQLSELLDRGPETLRDGFISPMLKEGVLELRYPDKPSRRDQAYRAQQGGQQ
ncbi:putative DNA binding domain-containing protein [Luteimonas sp. XNQY3]|nr:ATP-binding protein [Luteimonas sp. XNQY3]MCD9004677.1 putative DNA binding domain-containing protein [Luteimonas sp. XNQY3]